MKKILTIIVMLVCCIYSANSQDKTFVADGIEYYCNCGYDGGHCTARITALDNPPAKLIIPDRVTFEGVSYKVYDMETGETFDKSKNNIKSITIPNCFTVSQTFAFSENLEEIILGDSLDMRKYCLIDCPKLQKIVFKGTLYGFKNNVFGWSTSNMKRGFYMVSPVPPTVIFSEGRPPFDESVYNQVVLYVPANSVEKYKMDKFWGKFSIDVWDVLVP